MSRGCFLFLTKTKFVTTKPVTVYTIVFKFLITNFAFWVVASVTCLRDSSFNKIFNVR